MNVRNIMLMLIMGCKVSAVIAGVAAGKPKGDEVPVIEESTTSAVLPKSSKFRSLKNKISQSVSNVFSSESKSINPIDRDLHDIAGEIESVERKKKELTRQYQTALFDCSYDVSFVKDVSAEYGHSMKMLNQKIYWLTMKRDCLQYKKEMFVFISSKSESEQEAFKRFKINITHSLQEYIMNKISTDIILDSEKFFMVLDSCLKVCDKHLRIINEILELQYAYEALIDDQLDKGFTVELKGEKLVNLLVENYEQRINAYKKLMCGASDDIKGS